MEVLFILLRYVPKRFDDIVIVENINFKKFCNWNADELGIDSIIQTIRTI